MGRKRQWSIERRYRVAAFGLLFAAMVVAAGPAFMGMVVTGYVHENAWLSLLGMAGLFGVFGLASLLASGLSRQIVEPIIHLKNDVRRATVAVQQNRRGDVHVAPDVSDPDEIARLRDQVYSLQSVLQAKMDAEQRWLASIVHDVKAGLVGLGHLLDAKYQVELAGDASAAPAVTGSARDEARRLVHVVTRLGDLVRFTQLEKVDRQRISLDRLVDGVVRRSVGSARQRDVDVFLEAGPTSAVVFGDEVLLERAVANLVDNAVRVARRQVRVSVYPNLIRIQDDGPGLPNELEYLSQPFRSETLSIGGVPIASGSLGMGLFITRRVLEIHGGRLAVERSGSDGAVILAYVSRAG